MIDLDRLLSASARELESLPYYGLMAKLGLHSFNAQGLKPMELIAEYAEVDASSSVLVLGCGRGGSAIHLAEKTGARVRGIDLEPGSVEEAQATAASSPARDGLSFEVGHAGSSLPGGILRPPGHRILSLFPETGSLPGLRPGTQVRRLPRPGRDRERLEGRSDGGGANLSLDA